MRKPDFRGRSVKENKWVEGGLFLYPVNGEFPMRPCIVEDSPDLWALVEVDPDTISRSTGLQDKNGITVYEGDFISIEGHGEFEGLTSVVLVRYGIYFEHDAEEHSLGFYFRDEESDYSASILSADWCALKWGTVVGNKWDNPEMKEIYS